MLRNVTVFSGSVIHSFAYCSRVCKSYILVVVQNLEVAKSLMYALMCQNIVWLCICVMSARRIKLGFRACTMVILQELWACRKWRRKPVKLERNMSCNFLICERRLEEKLASLDFCMDPGK